MFIKSNETSHKKFMILVASNKKTFISQGSRMTTQDVIMCLRITKKNSNFSKRLPLSELYRGKHLIKSNETSHKKFMILVTSNKKTFISQDTGMTTQDTIMCLAITKNSNFSQRLPLFFFSRNSQLWEGWVWCAGWGPPHRTRVGRQNRASGLWGRPHWGQRRQRPEWRCRTRWEFPSSAVRSQRCHPPFGATGGWDLLDNLFYFFFIQHFLFLFFFSVSAMPSTLWHNWRVGFAR